MADFQFPNFTTPFPFQNLPQQLAASFVPPNQQFSNGGQYGRWNGVNNNAFGLAPSNFQSLFGSPTPPPMQFQPPYGNNGTMGSNQGPGSNPGGAPAPMPKIAGGMGGGLLGGITQSGGNFTPPSIPNVAGSNQAFSSNFTPNAAAGPGSLGAQQAHYLAMRPNSLQAQRTAAMPQSFTPGQFNQVAQQNPILAEQMAAQGGQGYRDAIMQQNGWSNDQMNQFINAYGSGAVPGFGAQQLAQLRSLSNG